MKILIVDDDQSNRDLLARILHPYGTSVMAEDGVVGVALFKEALKRGESFDLVLLDIMMPEMDGQQALKEIRIAEKAHYGISLDMKNYACIIMITGMDDPYQLVEAYTKGKCNGYLNKPIIAAEIIEKMRRNNLIE